VKRDFIEYLSRFVGKGSAVLDVGCGSGEFLRELVELTGARGMGVDPYSPERGEGDLEFRSLPAERIGELKGKFDLVYTVHSLHHFRDVEKFLKGALDVLEDEGQLVIIDWIKGADTGVPEDYFALEEVMGLMEKAGFGIQEKYIVGDSFVVRGRRKA